MPYDATDIQGLIIHVTWLCLSVPHWINPRFRLVFPALDNLAAIFPELGIVFVDGLFDVVQSLTPPTIDWFLSLSDVIPHNLWGIYVLVLQRGRKYIIYIGSGTSTVNDGVRYRVLQHKGRRVEPKHIRDAKDRGYKQVHEALLAWCDRPAAAKVPVCRTALVAIEAAFHLIFWPMFKRTTKYGFPDGPWARSAYDWTGVCHHNPLTEGVIVGVDDIQLSAEQLEYMAAVADERRRAVRRDYDRKLRANKTPQYAATRLAASRRHQPKASAKGKAAIAEKRYHCSTCNITCRKKWDLDRHYATPRHAANVADGCDLHCEPCNYQAKDRSNLRRHLSSARHQKKSQSMSN